MPPRMRKGKQQEQSVHTVETVERVTNNIWTLVLARTASVVAALGMAILAWNVSEWTDRVQTVQSAVDSLSARVLVIETANAKGSSDREKFQDQTLETLKELNNKLSAAQQDISKISGVLDAMRRRTDLRNDRQPSTGSANEG